MGDEGVRATGTLRFGIIAVFTRGAAAGQAEAGTLA